MNKNDIAWTAQKFLKTGRPVNRPEVNCFMLNQLEHFTKGDVKKVFAYVLTAPKAEVA